MKITERGFVNSRAISSAKNLLNETSNVSPLSQELGNNGRKSSHKESFKGLRNSGVYVREQKVDTGKKQVLTKLNILNNMSTEQFEEYRRESRASTTKNNTT